ncbi:hypothetical protein L3Q65_22350 [Amycolatopsis sp. FU40]|uniref:hypothetical protein n=1 Tax=Amycolatopsis sp. FU40 TaxID=2914159 RepID=UPI001F40CDCC|nr:hypothetical protein [Amycolatopsis sp. FU40]UKD59348.1 hypothetical protein L3Q65_22350 [Amycolatopsis sp. FU40]
MDTDPSRARVAFTGALHGSGAFLISALGLCVIAAALAAGAKVLSLLTAFEIIVVVSFVQFGLFALPVAAGIGALVASLGEPSRAARRVWITVSALTVVFPIGFIAVTAVRPA